MLHLGIQKKKIQFLLNFFKNIIDKNNKILSSQDPIYILKRSNKNRNIKKALLDKFLFWLKKFFKKI